jgi:hypothetical protein
MNHWFVEKKCGLVSPVALSGILMKSFIVTLVGHPSSNMKME